MKNPLTRTTTIAVGQALMAALVALALSGPAGPAPAGPIFTVTHAMIPMRDGVRLHTVIFAPRKAAGPLPFLMLRTPYGTPASDALLKGEPYKELVEEGYIFVFQDIRGRYQSGGPFVMQRPPRDRGRPAGDRREHGRLRHDRLAAQERAAETTAASACWASPTAAG